MKQVLVGGILIGLIGSTVLASSVVQAIPDTQILKKLQGVPVFALTDKNGSPLREGDAVKKSYVSAYLSSQDAQAALKKIGQDQPDLGKQLQIRPVSLSEIYKLQTSKKVDVVFVPQQSQVAVALALLQKKNRSLKKFEGVPLFLGLAGKQPGYLTISQNRKQVIPLFFDREQLQPHLDTYQKNNPRWAKTTGVRVLTLEGFLGVLSANNNPLYEKVVIMPSPEATALLHSSAKNPGKR
jgi:Tic22-like family